MGEPGLFVASKVTLQNLPIGRAIKQGSPGFQLSNARRCFPGMQLSHPPVIQILTSAHGVSEMHLPVITLIYGGQCGCDASFCHNGRSEEHTSELQSREN